MSNVLSRYIRFIGLSIAALGIVVLLTLTFVLRPNAGPSASDAQNPQANTTEQNPQANTTEQNPQANTTEQNPQPSAAEQAIEQTGAVAQQTTEPPGAFDPLSSEEQSRARTVAFNDSRIISFLGGTTVRHRTLLIERHEEAKDAYESGRWSRRAGVFIYKYSDNSLMHAVVNLSTNVVDATNVVQSVQLPFTPEEAAEALQVALNDTNTNSLIRTQFRAATGREFQGPGDLQAFAFTFNTAILPEFPSTTAACGRHRCGELMLIASGSGEVLAAAVIVDLSTMTVAYSSAL